MPSIVGNININSVGSSATVNIGDSFYIAPKNTSKTYAGSGSFNTGNVIGTTNGVNATNTTDNDLVEADQPLAR